METVIVTGASGYIGGSICKVLEQKGFKVIGIDRDFLNNDDKNELIVADLTNDEDVNHVKKCLQLNCKGDGFYSMIHCAAWKDLGGSYRNPYEYYRNNVISTLNALQIAHIIGVKTFIYSSSAAVYDDNSVGAIKENTNLKGNSPYGYSKLCTERIVSDICRQYEITSYCLRYQNPMGAIDPEKIDLADSMFGNILNHLTDGKFIIFGGDYNTSDGTCIRDYIDIRDLIKVHLELINMIKPNVHKVLNVGKGIPVTCKEVCDAVKLIEPGFKYTIGSRRSGDSAGSYADTTKLNRLGIICDIKLEDSISNLIKIYKSSHNYRINRDLEVINKEI